VQEHFLYASSGATYGDGSLGFSDDITLLDNLKPLNIYGYSKHAFDLFLKNNNFFNFKNYHYKLIGLKFFNVFGANEYHKGDMRSVVLKAYHQIKKDGKVRLFKSYNKDYKDGEQKRDFIYIKDVIEIIWFLIENIESIPSNIYNVGSGKANTWIKLIDAIFSALRMESNIEYIDMPDNIKTKYQYYTKADISKLRKIGYEKPFFPLEDAVKDYVNVYLENNIYLANF
jgi:ADP-L-glycero-D-manno-heptose 6-epimerase